jgi:hypothetical protein
MIWMILTHERMNQKVLFNGPLQPFDIHYYSFF